MKPRESMRSSKQNIARYWQESRANPKPSQKLKPLKEPGSPTATPISMLPTRLKIKPSNTAPSILSTSLSFEPSSRGARSPPSKTCFFVTRPNSIPEAHARKVQVAGTLELERNKESIEGRCLKNCKLLLGRNWVIRHAAT